jgi:hypothetical protein
MSFVSFVAHRSVRDVEHYSFAVLTVIQAHTAFPTLNDAIEAGNAVVETWHPEPTIPE